LRFIASASGHGNYIEILYRGLGSMRTLSFVSGKNAGGVLASAVLAISLSTVGHATTTISGVGAPPSSVAVNRYYGFQAWATDNTGRAVTYSIRNKPAWATFDTKYGHLYGVPTTASVGTYSSIVISATDGLTTASLPAFNIAVTGTGTSTSGGGSTGGTTTSGTGAATVHWNPPTANTNGSTINNLSGYVISYGTNSKALSTTVKLTNPGLTSYMITGLSRGTYYFAVSAYNSAGQTSSLSNLASKTIQ
jgi:putative Ig domain-containing protein/fibronectin type III domain protein